ncbi:MAG TPA: hypothetical protein VHP30_01165, partial [Ignavibacteriales bacterium]|nr:hypothetical protein [Ignavibacteriales bacterium]
MLIAFLLQSSGYCQTQTSIPDTANVSQLQQTPADMKFPPNYNQIIPALNYKDADLRDIIRSIAYEYKTNVVIDNAVNMRASIALFNIELMSALKIIAEDNGLVFSFDENRFFIKQRQTLPPPEPPAPEMRLIVNYSKGKLELDLKNADINLLIDELRKKTNKNYLASGGLSGRLNGSLKAMELKQALNHIFRNNGFAVWQKDSIYYIARDYSPNAAEGASNAGGYWVTASDDLVSIRVVDADLNRIVDDISAQLNLPLIKLSPMSAKVTLKCEQVSLE